MAQRHIIGVAAFAAHISVNEIASGPSASGGVKKITMETKPCAPESLRVTYIVEIDGHVIMTGVFPFNEVVKAYNREECVNTDVKIEDTIDLEDI